jgi:hypothetical protein
VRVKVPPEDGEFVEETNVQQIHGETWKTK